MKGKNQWPKIIAVSFTLFVTGCSAEQKKATTPEKNSVVKKAESNTVTVHADAAPAKVESEIRTISLSGKTATSVPRSDLSVTISGSFHKSRAPLVGVSILVSAEDGAMAEVDWRIESGEIDSSWRPIAGERWDKAASTNVEEKIAGWLVRLDSVDEQSAGGDPTAITISLKPS